MHGSLKLFFPTQKNGIYQQTKRGEAEDGGPASSQRVVKRLCAPLTPSMRRNPGLFLKEQIGGELWEGEITLGILGCGHVS